MKTHCYYYGTILIEIRNVMSYEIIVFVLVVLDSIQDNTDGELNKNKETLNMNLTVSLNGDFILILY